MISQTWVATGQWKKSPIYPLNYMVQASELSCQ